MDYRLEDKVDIHCPFVIISGDEGKCLLRPASKGKELYLDCISKDYITCRIYKKRREE